MAVSAIEERFTSPQTGRSPTTCSSTSTRPDRAQLPAMTCPTGTGRPGTKCRFGPKPKTVAKEVKRTRSILARHCYDVNEPTATLRTCRNPSSRRGGTIALTI